MGFQYRDVPIWGTTCIWCALYTEAAKIVAQLASGFYGGSPQGHPPVQGMGGPWTGACLLRADCWKKMPPTEITHCLWDKAHTPTSLKLLTVAARDIEQKFVNNSGGCRGGDAVCLIQETDVSELGALKLG